MSSVSKEIVDAILDKDNINANEKIYNALYGKSSEQLQARKIEIAKHFFDSEDESTEPETEPETETEVDEISNNAEVESPEEPPEQ